jgi:hypothetical protein
MLQQHFVTSAIIIPDLYSFAFGMLSALPLKKTLLLLLLLLLLLSIIRPPVTCKRTFVIQH